MTLKKLILIGTILTALWIALVGALTYKQYHKLIDTRDHAAKMIFIQQNISDNDKADIEDAVTNSVGDIEAVINTIQF